MNQNRKSKVADCDGDNEGLLRNVVRSLEILAKIVTSDELQR